MRYNNRNSGKMQPNKELTRNKTHMKTKNGPWNGLLGVISKKKAQEISPLYVAFVERTFDTWKEVYKEFSTLKRGQTVLTYLDGNFVIAKVASIDSKSFLAVDGPVVRVRDNEASWRVDGDKYAWPL